MLCRRCEIDKPDSEFPVRRGRPNYWLCVLCARQYKKAHYRANTESYKQRIGKYNEQRRQERRKVLDAAKSKPCLDCGHSFPPWVMQFDHVTGVKVADVSEMLTWSLDTLMAEIEKCDVVCANCHADRTHRRRHSTIG